MAHRPNKLSQFWKELKRRKVGRVITVYAAAAFVILELTSIVAPSLGLPDWTLNLVIILLCVGFIIAVILSWMYDMHPEEGMVKTEPSSEQKAEERPASSSGWKIASYISFVVILGLIILNIISRTKPPDANEILDKSIAVLPFRNDSPDEETRYFINGTMEAILDNLCKVEDLRVPGRTSVEQYRGVSKAIPVIAKELGVSYILEGSGQKLGNRILLTVQLLDGATDTHLWSGQYDRRIKSIEELIDIYSEIAQLVAAEIEAIITPEEKELIEKIPTTSLTAWDFYQRGKEESSKEAYLNQEFDSVSLERAEYLYHYALKHDSTFAEAYVGLANVFWDKHYWDTYFSDDFLDSVLILVDLALSYDDQLAEAYVLKGEYYLEFGKREMAIELFDRAIELNPNYGMAYYSRGNWYWNEDLVKTIENFRKAESLNRGQELVAILGGLCSVYGSAGFPERSKYYSEEILKLDDDSLAYYNRLTYNEYYKGNYEQAIETGKKGLAIDSTNYMFLVVVGQSLAFLGQYEKSLDFYKKALVRWSKISEIAALRFGFRFGFIYWMNGFKNEADYYLNRSIEILNREKELAGDAPTSWLYYDLAAAYAFKGETDKVYENLRMFSKWPIIDLHMSTLIKNDPLFMGIRDEPEFQQIVRIVKAKYQAEHGRVRKWLEENDNL